MRRRTLLERGWLGRVRRRFFWRRVLVLTVPAVVFALAATVILISR